MVVRKAFLLSSLAAAVLFYGFLFQQQAEPMLAGVSDFPCFYSAGKLVVFGQGSSVYSYQAEAAAQAGFIKQIASLTSRHGPLPFVFPPFTLLIFAPLAMLPYPFALKLWYGLNVCLLLVFPFLFRSRLSLSLQQISIAVLCMPLFIPASICLVQGQPSILILLLFSLAFLQLERGRQLSAGALLAASAFKPQLLIPLLVALAVATKWKTLTSFFATILLLSGCSMPLVGWRMVIEFPRAVVKFGKLPAELYGEHPESMPNLRGLIYVAMHPALLDSMLFGLTIAMSLLLLLLVTFYFRKYPKFSPDSYSFLILCALLLSYHAYLHDLVLMLLPFLLLFSAGRQPDAGNLKLVTILAAGTVFLTPSLGLSPGFCAVALILLAFLLYLQTVRNQQLAGCELIVGITRPQVKVQSFPLQ